MQLCMQNASTVLRTRVETERPWIDCALQQIQGPLFWLLYLPEPLTQGYIGYGPFGVFGAGG